MVHSEVYLNKYVVSMTSFSLQPPIQKTALFCMFSLFNFSSIFPGGQLTRFAPMFGRPCAWIPPPLPIHASVNFLLPVKVLARHVTSKMTPVHEANATASEKHICLIVCLFCRPYLFINPHQERETQFHKRSTV